MLMYGNAINVINTGIVFNLTSMKEGFPRLPRLIPPNDIGRFTGRDFDLAYANYIMSNDFIFKEFFDIVYSLYMGTDVYIIISEDEWSENLIESLLKLIQQRYGYNAGRINYIDDYYFMFNSKNYNDFDPRFGIANLDTDKERYTYIVESLRIKSGEPLIINPEVFGGV